MNILELIKRKDYINVEEMMFLEDRLNFLIAIWKDIILKNSDKKMSELKDNQKNALIQFKNEFNINMSNSISVGKLDIHVVKYILFIAVKLKKPDIVDNVFKRTKSAAKAMPQYFYPTQIIEAYIGLLEIDKAKSILDFVAQLEYKSYWYTITYINKEYYKNYPEFFKALKQAQYECFAKLIHSGEIININMDLEMLKGINQYIS